MLNLNLIFSFIIGLLVVLLILAIVKKFVKFLIFLLVILALVSVGWFLMHYLGINVSVS